uniref:Putative RNA-binding eukaryotic snRNP-like protein n=3 Tax=environmental samples TaxID=68359 RepID=A0A075FSJ9_9EURY|nr:putative RNA-binding eukaryotic snRNP-like protein [uncultured marine group II/III euryarchaeote AD1000_07_F07]AIE92602.1 putative RNA-binding eukaryotic snRNP-like protein [uncultured marine group II/III euryarchaeote AD1000_25_A05]|tara:strand:+ start:399 stop:2540 length:2142 start_codon:yes stop_codon:yes gene_type:complete
MREQSSSFDVARIVRELSELVGARARKAYQPHYEQVVLRLNRKGVPSTDLVIVRGRRVYTSQRDRPMPSKPSQFAMVLRKHLNNSRLIAVEQFGFDRVIQLTFEHGGGRLRLVIELFRDGNVLLLDDSGVIIQPLTHAKYASRSLKKGVAYAPPPETVDPREMDRSALDALLDGSDHDLIRTLAARANFGRIYGSTACSIAGLEEKIDADSLDSDQRDSLEGAIQSMLTELSEGDGAMMWMVDSDSMQAWQAADNEAARDAASSGITEIAPFDLAYTDSGMMVEVASLSMAYDAVFGSHDAAAFIRREEELLVESGEDEGVKQAKLDRRAAQQRSAIDRFHERAAITQELGKAIQDNWEHVDSLLAQFNEAVASDGWEGVMDRIHDVPWIDNADPARQTIVAYLPDEDGEPGASITLEVSKTVHQNAQRYFEEGRSQKSKAKGAQAALAGTEEAREKAEKRAAKDAAAGRLRARQRSKRFWFEKHRWAMLSGGHLLIGGRDAKGNDVVVRKHLSSHDLYFHADLHGAPSCSLKLKDGLAPNQNPSEAIPEGVASLQIVQNLADGTEDARELSESLHSEAAQVAVCWSRAWGSGGAAAVAFHARPSQVSKTTESGESLGRGSFVVRGQRNWHRDLPLELAVGMAVVNGVPMPVSGTPSTISEHCQRWVKVTPGREKKEAVANRISKATGLVQDDLLSCLPPGNCSVEDHGLIQP